MRLFLSALLLLLISTLARADEPRDQLHEAARQGDVKRVKELLAGGADVNARNRFGATPLWFAIYKEHADVVKLLLEHKADPTLGDNIWGMTPLSMAASADKIDAFKVLLATKAGVPDYLLFRLVMAGKADRVAAVLQRQKPPEETLSAALALAPASSKDVKELLTKAGGKPFPAATEEEQKRWKGLAGDYESATGARLFVQLRNGTLLAMTGRTGFGVLRPVDERTFRLVGDGGGRLRFELKGAEVTRVALNDVAFDPVKDKPLAKPVPYKDAPAVVREVKNWPSFRGEGATGVADGQHPPGVWDVKKLNAASWKTPIPGLGHSCPVTWGDRLFITTAVSSDPKSELKPGLYGAIGTAKDRSKHTWKVYCLDRKSGKILWERIAHEGVPLVKRHTKATHANATPATDGRHLIVSFGSEGLFCYDLDGNLRWKKDLGLLDPGMFSEPEIQWEAGSSPVIWRDLVIVQCDRSKDSFVAAYRLDDGKQVWRTPRDEPSSWGTPTVVEGRAGPELVTNGTNAVRGYDPATGKELWRLGRNSQITVPTPFAGDGLIYVTSGYAPIQPIYAVWPGARGDLTLKAGQESSDSVAWAHTRGGTYMTTPVYYRGYLYTCSNAGQVTCYEGRTGKQVYREKLAGNLGYTSSPVAADGRLYFTGEDGKVSVVEAGPAFKLLAVNDVGETCLATPAVAGGMIYFRTQGHLLGIARDG